MLEFSDHVFYITKEIVSIDHITATSLKGMHTVQA